MKNHLRQVLLGLLLSLLLSGVVFGTGGFGPPTVNTNDNTHCHWGCCLSISGWCVWTCIVCDEVPVGQ